MTLADFLFFRPIINQPNILSLFGDIAQVLGPQFDPYLTYVGQVLFAAAGTPRGTLCGYEREERRGSPSPTIRIFFPS